MILYRGQSKQWPLLPTGFREYDEKKLARFSQELKRKSKWFAYDYRLIANNIFEIFDNYDMCYEPKFEEFRNLRLSKHLLEDVNEFTKKFIDVIGGGFPLVNFLEDMSYFQHYGKKTPMLDFSEDLQTAVNFAKREDGSYGCLFVFSPHIYYEKIEQKWLFDYPYEWNDGTNEHIVKQQGHCLFCCPTLCPNNHGVDLTFDIPLNTYQLYDLSKRPPERLQGAMGPKLLPSNENLALDEFYELETFFRLGVFSRPVFKKRMNMLIDKYGISGKRFDTSVLDSFM